MKEPRMEPKWWIQGRFLENDLVGVKPSSLIVWEPWSKGLYIQPLPAHGGRLAN
jgi:hypothetical protein